MKLHAVLVGFGLVSCIASVDVEFPGCVTNCWDNSKYVSTCTMLSEESCLCEDAQFQNIVLQCLYSQCQTSEFGSALHYALSACSDFESNDLGAEPPLIRYQSLRKRGIPSVRIASGYVSASVVHSVARRSASAPAYPNFSARVSHGNGRIPAATLSLPSQATTTSLEAFSSDVINSSPMPTYTEAS